MARQLKNHKMDNVRNLILKTFHFLEDKYFYYPVNKEENDDFFIESSGIEYVSENKKRKILISYTKGKVDNEIVHTFTASITRIPYKDVEDFFSLDNYLDSNGNNFSTNFINEFNETKAENILYQISNALRKHALGIIEGKEWLDSYYPRKD
jgi:hypothetical protein